MTISLTNGFLNYTVDEDAEEVVIDLVKVNEQLKGTGRQLLNMVKDIACELGYKVSLYAYPQDDTITDDELFNFYRSCGFELSADDVDGRMFEY